MPAAKKDMLDFALKDKEMMLQQMKETFEAKKEAEKKKLEEE